MRLSDRLQHPKPVFSFEFFPPKTEAGIRRLFATVEHLAELEPDFVSVTYGAGGGTRNVGVEMAARIQREIGVQVVAHLTCVGQSREEIGRFLDELDEARVPNVLALRGDPPRGEASFTPHPDGFSHASELVAFIRQRQGFCIGAACYPEGHIENPSPDDDLRWLKVKVDAGVDFLITQLFFEPAVYLRFIERARAGGIAVPIIPGVMPITNVAQIERFTQMCGASLPAKLLGRLHKVRDDEQAVMATGIEWAIDQCRALLALGAPGIHFYTLNKSLATRVVCRSLRG